METTKQDQYNNPFQATLTGILNLFRKQEKAGELTPGDRLEGKTVVVDGASSGLGFAIATGLAKRGARVIMVCRSGIPEKGEKVKQLSGSRQVFMLHVDYADLDSVKKLVSEIKNRYAPIDILVSNAGMVAGKSRKLKTGVEEMFMVNYLSKYILVRLLLQNDCFHTTDSSAVPRIIFISSETHRNPKGYDWGNFGVYQPFTMGKSVGIYGVYKMFLTTFAAELSRRLNKNNKVNYSLLAICPGPVNSNIGREAPLIFHPLMKLVFAIFFRSPSKASIPVIWLACSKDIEGKPFDYLFLHSRKEIDKKSADPDNGQRLWDLSEKLLMHLGVNLDSL